MLLYLKYSVFHFPDRKFGEYSLSAEETAELLCKADVVSFDIFDTLIFRSVSPKEVFDNTGRTLGIENFGKIRADSENEARKEKKEPCINDIYRIIAVKAGLTDKAAEEAVKAECNEEISVCRADPFMLDVYGRVISCGKRSLSRPICILPKALSQSCFATTGSAVMKSCSFRANTGAEIGRRAVSDN